MPKHHTGRPNDGLLPSLPGKFLKKVIAQVDVALRKLDVILTASPSGKPAPNANGGHQVVSHSVVELLRVLVLVIDDNIQGILSVLVNLLQRLVHAVSGEGSQPIHYHSDFLLVRKGVRHKCRLHISLLKLI